MTNNVVAISDGVNGNISSCEVQTVLIETGRHRLFQFSQVEKYQVINKCDNSIISTYTDVSMTLFGLLSLVLMVLFVGFVVSEWLDNY